MGPILPSSKLPTKLAQHGGLPLLQASLLSWSAALDTMSLQKWKIRFRLYLYCPHLAPSLLLQLQGRHGRFVSRLNLKHPRSLARQRYAAFPHHLRKLS